MGLRSVVRNLLKGGKSQIWTNPPSRFKHSKVRPGATYSPWFNDQAFMKLYEQIKGNTLVDIYRCYDLWTLARQLHHVEGDVLEVGVWRGGTGAVLAQAVKDTPSRRVFLADTFTGVVKAGSRDTRYTGGEHADTSLDVVKDLLANLKLDNVTLLKGIFPEDTAHEVPGKIALLHSDVDVYQSSKDIVEWCLPRLSPGGMIVFDDFGFGGCEGVTQYCEELRQTPGLRFFHNLNGHAIFIKMAS